MDFNDFPDTNDIFTSFLHRFLSPENDQHLERFKIIYSVCNFIDNIRFMNWINSVIRRRIYRLEVYNEVNEEFGFGHMPMSIYSCERLVNLYLSGVYLYHPESISLPCVKTMHLYMVLYEGGSTLETLISSSPVLEDLFIIRCPNDSPVVDVCIRSHSLKRLEIISEQYDISRHFVVIDAPRLWYMSLADHQSTSIIIENIGSSAKVDIDVIFHDENYEQLAMIDNFLTKLSTVSAMTISSDTLQVIRYYSEMGRLPEFSNLTHLHAYLEKTLWEMFPYFLESFPNLKYLQLEFLVSYLPKTEKIDLSSLPQCFLSSLEVVELVTSKFYTKKNEEAKKMKLAKYFLENCGALKKLIIDMNFCNIIDEIKSIPKRSTVCEIVML